MHGGPRCGLDKPRDQRRGNSQMNDALLKLYLKLEALGTGEEGQDLVEYGLLVAMIALVCISGISKVAGGVNAAYSNISSSLA
jgi:pilus assembly protein Flp/PilA